MPQMLHAFAAHPLYGEPVPEGDLYRAHVAEEIGRAYPGTGRDATGRATATPAIRPEDVRPFDPRGASWGRNSLLTPTVLAGRDVPEDPASGMVHVRAYEQARDGKSVHVSDYERHRPGSASGTDAAGGQGRDRGQSLLPRLADSGAIMTDGSPGAAGDNPGQASKPSPPFVSEKTPQEIIESAHGGWVSSGPDQGSRECVALVKDAVPKIGPTSQWQAGDQLHPGDDLAPGTPIARGFDENGNYRSRPTGNHAGLFMRWENDNKGRPGMVILDQWAPRYDRNSGEEIRKGKPAGESRVPPEKVDDYHIN